MRALPTVVLAAVSLLAAACATADAAEPSPHDVGRVVARRPPPMPPPPRPVAAARVELTSASGARLPTFTHDGRTFVMGTRGERYKIRVRNPLSERVEVVVSVDGLDAIDGRPASRQKRGYVLEPFGALDIEGFRTSMDEVAAFRFSSVRDSYAAKKDLAENVGVIGVAVFRERPRPVVIAPRDEAPPRERHRAPARPAPAARGSGDDRAGLGTGFGERRRSVVSTTSFERASESPFSTATLRYDDRDGLVAAGVPVDPPVDGEAVLRRRAEPFPADRRFAEPPP